MEHHGFKIYRDFLMDRYYKHMLWLYE